MNLRILIVIVVSLLLTTYAYAGSAIWDLNPGSGDWNTATNWTPATVPNGSADTATFDLSNTTSVTTSADTTLDGITFNSGASAYTITIGQSHFLNITGTGVTNSSGVTQNFVAPGHEFGIFFRNSSTAGTSTSFTISNGIGSFAGGRLHFLDAASAGSAVITNDGGTAAGHDPGTTEFQGGTTTAGSATIINNAGTVSALGGITSFESGPGFGIPGSPTAGTATFINNGGTTGFGGLTEFFGTSTAANGTFSNYGGTFGGSFGSGSTVFNDTSSANSGTFNNYGGSVSGAQGGETVFSSTSTAANAMLTNMAGTVSGGGGGFTSFGSGATAGSATIINEGATVTGAGGGFTNIGGTAGSATIINNGGTGGGAGGSTFFVGSSSGGTSRIEIFGNGTLDISNHDSPGVTVGSIEGSGIVLLGKNNLTVGSNDMGTTFSGVIEDGGLHGSLTKIGMGTLDLTGTNTYAGSTNVNGGVLQVDGSITSNTRVNAGGTLSGTGTIYGSVTNAIGGTVSPGGSLPGTFTFAGDYVQDGHSTLQINIAGAGPGQFSLLDVLGTATLTGSNVDILDPALLNGFVPMVGESFTFFDYSSLTGGTFIIPDANINGSEHWVVTYQPTDAILTVAAGNVPILTVPDHGSTLLLMTLALLGLGACQWRDLVRERV